MYKQKTMIETIVNPKLINLPISLTPLFYTVLLVFKALFNQDPFK